MSMWPLILGRTAEAFARVPLCEAQGLAKCRLKETGSAVAVVCVKASVVHNIRSVV